MRVFFNEDAFHFWMTRFDAKEKVDLCALKNFIYQYKKTSITDFVLNVNFSTSITDSKVFDTFLKKYYKKSENGEPVNYENDYPKLLHELNAQGIDPYEVFISSLKEIKINPWISIRMDDVHHTQEKVHLWKDENIEKCPNRWISNYRSPDFYFDKCRNYLLKSVRQEYLSYIKEQLLRYDVYGLEMDFTREPYCFPIGLQDKGREVMTEFVRSVRKTIDEIGKKRKKKIYLSMICQANPQTAYNNGFDIQEIVGENLLDFLTVSPRWATINTDVPIETWKKLIDCKALLGVNQQLLVRSEIHEPDVYASYDMDFGQAVANLSRGSDYIYLYNHFDTVERRNLSAPHSTSFRNKELLQRVLVNIGCERKLKNEQRRIPITFDDFQNGYENITSQLPILRNGIISFRIPTGKITKKDEVYFTFRTSEKINPEVVEIYANTVKGEFVINSMEDKNIVKGNVYSYRIKIDALVNVCVEVITHGLIEIDYAEILIKGKNGLY